MKKLYILIYDNKEEYGEWLEAYPFDEREEDEGINEDKTCFIQKIMFHNEECFKIKVEFGYTTETCYYPVSRYSIRHVEIFQ